MTNVLRVSKKAFTWSVVLMTIAWSMGLAALAPLAARAATCPEFSEGDLVSPTTASDVFYITESGDRLYFPTDRVFKTWYADFSEVTEVAPECLDGADLAGGVNPRPGSLMVKSSYSPSVYLIGADNMRHKLGSGDVATALFGTSWPLIDYPDVFMANLHSGADASIPTLMNGMLVKKSTGATYYVWGGKTHAIDGTLPAFLAAQVRTVSDSVFGSVSMDTASVSVATITEDPTQGTNGTSGSTGTTPVLTGSVTVSLSATTPVSGTILSDSTSNEYPQSLISFTAVNFTAGADADAKVTSVKFNRTGIGSDSDIGNLYLYEGDTKLAEYTSFNDKVVTFTNSNGLFTVGKGTSKTITLKGDLARGSTSVTGGKTYGFTIAAAASVVASGSVGGSFPVSGNLMETTAVSDLGHVYLTSYTTYPSTVKADESNKELWRFTATASDQDMEIRRLMLTMVGTVDTDDIQNFRLEVGGVTVGTAVPMLTDAKTLTFDLSAAPVAITSGQSKIFVLRGDMKGGSGRVFKFTIQRQADVSAYDTEYGVYNPVAKDAVSTAFGIIQPVSGNGTSVDSGTLTIGVNNTSPTGNIADAATNITLATFNFTATGEDVKVENLGVSCNGSDTSDILKNVKVMVEGTQVGSTVSSMTCSYSTSTYTFGNTFVVPAGPTGKKVSVVADTTDSTVAANATLRVNLAAGSSNATGQITLTSLSSSAQSAYTLTVKSGTASVTKNTGFGDRGSSQPTGTVNASGVKLGSFIVTAGAGEAIDLTQIALKDDATYPLGNNFQNLKVMNGATQLGTTINSLNTTAGTYAFTPASAIRIASGQQYIVDVYADVKSSVSNSATSLSPALSVDSVTATGVNTSADASYTTDVSLQAAYIAAAGSLTVALDNASPVSTQVVQGSTDVTLGMFKLTASASEDIEITDLTVSVSTTPFAASATGTTKNFKLYMDGVQVPGSGTGNYSGSGTTTYNNVSFTGFTLVIPKNASKVLTVKADITPFDDGGDSNSYHRVALLTNIGSGSYAFTARGKSSGTTVTAPSADVSANPMHALRTKISVAFSADTPSGSAVGGSDSIVAKFVISNSANVGNYDATIKALNLAISQTGISNTADRTLKVYKDSITSANLVLTTSWLASGVQNFGNTAITDAGFTDVNVTAGGSRTFIVTADTNDAGSDDKLSIGIAADDVTWDDGDSNTLSEVPDSLPLNSKTLTY